MLDKKTLTFRVIAGLALICRREPDQVITG